jgi:lipopolysaccharide/colanic/teichoic acid biosynthesis glycosyltransferase
MQNFIKFTLDKVLSSIGIIVLSPIILLISLLIILQDGFPFLYISKRYISTNKEIKIYKFRSMVKDATLPRHNLSGRFMKDGYLDIPLDCEIYTPIGRILERTQLVEILQLLNVIFNGMSLIGNRPLPHGNIVILKKINHWEKRFDSPAGLTGISQVVGKHNLTPEVRLTLEAGYSSLYQNNNTLLVDLKIVYYTCMLIFFKKSLALDKAYSLLKLNL